MHSFWFVCCHVNVSEGMLDKSLDSWQVKWPAFCPFFFKQEHLPKTKKVWVLKVDDSDSGNLGPLSPKTTFFPVLYRKPHTPHRNKKTAFAMPLTNKPTICSRWKIPYDWKRPETLRTGNPESPGTSIGSQLASSYWTGPSYGKLRSQVTIGVWSPRFARKDGIGEFVEIFRKMAQRRFCNIYYCCDFNKDVVISTRMYAWNSRSCSVHQFSAMFWKDLRKSKNRVHFFFPGSFFFQEGIFEDFYWDCCHLFFVSCFGGRWF